MSEQSVIGVYNTMSEAEQAVNMLDKGSFPIKQVSIVADEEASATEVRILIEGKTGLLRRAID